MKRKNRLATWLAAWLAAALILAVPGSAAAGSLGSAFSSFPGFGSGSQFALTWGRKAPRNAASLPQGPGASGIPAAPGPGSRQSPGTAAPTETPSVQCPCPVPATPEP